MKFVVAVGDIGQALKVENLSRDEGASGDGNPAGEADATF